MFAVSDLDRASPLDLWGIFMRVCLAAILSVDGGHPSLVLAKQENISWLLVYQDQSLGTCWWPCLLSAPSGFSCAVLGKGLGWSPPRAGLLSSLEL